MRVSATHNGPNNAVETSAERRSRSTSERVLIEARLHVREPKQPRPARVPVIDLVVVAVVLLYMLICIHIRTYIYDVERDARGFANDFKTHRADSKPPQRARVCSSEIEVHGV